MPPPADVATNASPSLVDMLHATLQDEYHAMAIYQRVLADHGANTWPFVNIVRAEANHAAAIARLHDARSIAVPSGAWTVDNVPRFATVAQACAAAADAEVENVRLYDRFLALDLPSDVRTVFSNNRQASQDNHLPAFQRCR
jgi:hypothetical protein